MVSDPQDQLYVKIEGQDEILEDLESVQRVVENIRRASRVLEEAREVRQRSIESIQNNISRLNGSLQGLQAGLPHPEGKTPQGAVPPADEDEMSEVDTSIEELNTELQNLQQELSSIENLD